MLLRLARRIVVSPTTRLRALSTYSVIVAPANGNSGAIRRNPSHKDALVSTFFPEVKTLYDAFQ